MIALLIIVRMVFAVNAPLFQCSLGLATAKQQPSKLSYIYSFYASRNILLVHKLKERKNRP
jgi:hypothetical protein